VRVNSLLVIGFVYSPYFFLISRTMGLFGLYFSLQYLSLSDATVLTFMVPTTTALAAAILLKEVYTIQQAMSGRKLFSITLRTDSVNEVPHL